MKKRLISVILVMAMVSALTACGKDGDGNAADQNSAATEGNDTSTPSDNANGTPIVVENNSTEVEEAPAVEEEPEEVREGYYRSELTNEWTDESIKNQRPIAVMVDNEKTALPHYGTSKADIVYEMMNSTLNDRITRFMCIFKDYNNIEQIGSIRSVRTTNLQISPEYNAIVVHDGGPLYINAYFEAPYVEHLSGGFARIKNGKPTEFTEYITPGEITDRCKSAGIDLEYNDYYQGSHWQFAKPNKQTDLSERLDSFDAKKVELPYKHNGSTLTYMPETNTYRYSEYGQEYIDALTNEHMEFTNVILQESKFTQFDEHGYMNFWIHENENMHGYYLTGGKAIPITWAKDKYDMFPTQFYVAEGTMVQMNIGKTYICIVPDDSWDQIAFEE